MAIDFDALQLAVHQAVVAACQLNAAKVIWAKQDGPSPGATTPPTPPVPYVTLLIGDVLNIGADEAEHEFDESAPAGQEVTERVGGPRRITITMEAFCAKTNGSTGAVALLEKTKTRLNLPSIAFEVFREAKLTVDTSTSTVADLSTVRHVGFEGRASVDFYVSTENYESDTPTGYIQTVRLVDLTGDDVIAPGGYNDGGA